MKDLPGRKVVFINWAGAANPFKISELGLARAGIEIARQLRSYGTGVFVSDPLHYLALIETKPNALDQAAALQG